VTAWHEGPLLGFDTETTGTDVWGDRIVTAALVYKPGFHEEPIRYEFMIDTGEEIPEGATKIHGITTEMMRDQGKPAVQVLSEINLLIHEFTTVKSATLVAYNAPYDLTLLREDSLRAGATVAPQLGLTPVLDPWVIDKQTDKYRKGKRNLSTTAESFGIDSTGAHGALADVIMTMRVAYKLAAKFPKLQVPAETIHGWQVTWKAQQNADYQSYLRKSKPDAVVDGAWPIEPPREAVTVGDGVTW
jgi:DNA polymerase-3 subunit epsilon